VAVGEFNGDGKPDLVVGTGTGLEVLLGNGDGTFQVKSTVPFLVDPSVPDLTEAVTAVAVGDFRGDGKQDIVANASGNLSVLHGNGDGTFQNPINLNVGPVAVDSLVLGDFTGHGKLDIVTGNAAPSFSGGPTLSVLAGNGDGTFQGARIVNVGEAGTALAAGDFRGDGKLDLAATNFLTNDVAVLLNTSPPPSQAAPAATATSLAADTSSAVFGQPVTLTATVTSSGGTPTGTVTFRDGNRVLGEVAVDPNGQATLVVPFGVGIHSLTASFAGIAPFTASTSAALAETVHQAATTAALAVDEIAGPSVVFLTATVAPVAPGAGVPTGTVTFRDGNTVLGTGTLDQNGQAFLLVQSGLAPGTNSLTASYGADGNFLTSTSAATIETVSAPAATATALSASVNSSVFGQPVTLTASVTSSAGTPAGVVTFFADGNVLGSATLNGAGPATLTVSLGTGPHSLTASFGATSAFAASTSAATTVTVNRAATTTALNASLHSVVTGQSVVFTATLAAVAPGAGTPSGTVTFLDGNVPLGTATVGGGGTATFSTSFAAVGSHTITAVYSGDGHFTGSSQAVTEQISALVAPAPTTTVLVASANPATTGQTVTFTATVSAAPGTGTLTGTVTFVDGNVVLATVTLDATGKARLRVRFRAAGKHTIRTAYSGDRHFAASSQSLTELVN
jgi:hypothetical protein